MANINNLNGIVTKELHVFYLIDNSGSMIGQPISTVNCAMRETVEELKDIVAKNDISLKIAAMEFNSTVRWITGGERHLEDVDDFIWEDLTAYGRTSLGSALNLLNQSLSANNMMHSETGNKCPVVIIMSDGAPTDEWMEQLERLEENKWFRQASKIAIAIGDRADRNVLARVVGSKNAVICANNLDVLRRLIKIVSVTSSLSSSHSRSTSTPLNGTMIVNSIYNENPEAFGDIMPGQGFMYEQNMNETFILNENADEAFDMGAYDSIDFDEMFNEEF